MPTMTMPTPQRLATQPVAASFQLPKARLADLHVRIAAAEFLKADVALPGAALHGRGERAVVPFDFLGLLVQIEIVDQLAVEDDLQPRALEGDLVGIPFR